ncbi:MAG: M14 family metallopeptidase [Acidobacteriota bacterium]|nr:M14 family metallopeptidase [Acidobacteriota bacterium]
MLTRMPALAVALCFALTLATLARPITTPQHGNAQRQIANVPAGRTLARVPAPEDVFGFRPGDDRKLANWQSIVEYFQKLDAASDRVKFEEIGKTTLGAPFTVATISAPENLARLDEFKEIQRQLADPRTLGRNADQKAKQLVERGKTIVLITCGIHSTEVGSTLSSTLIAHRLASSNEPDVLNILRDTIVLLVPSLNPDGVDIVKRWYDKTLGTPYEGTTPPELYHKYVGHDNNRDWYAFTQVETQLTVDKIHNVWHPQIVHDIHQQGQLGARLFVPPYMKPVEPNVPPQIVEGYTELGNHIAGEMRAAGFKGITTNSSYDAWTPARAYSHYHGGVRILSETASAKVATPLTVKFDDLRPDEGYDPRKVSDKFPELWPGGEWKLRNITDYMTTAAFSLMKHAAQNRGRWLERFYEVGKEAVRERKAGEVYAYVLPAPGNVFDWLRRDELLKILRRAGVKVDITSLFKLGDKEYEQMTAVVRLAQPYGGFAKALLETQSYPNLRDPEGNPVSPYDVTAHTLSLLMGVKVEAVTTSFKYPLAVDGIGPGADESNFTGTRRALYKSHVPSMDEGWTRWVFKQNSFAPSTMEDSEIRAGGLRVKYDTIIIPDHSPRAILEGYKQGTMPDEYTGGLGADGVKALRKFVEEGGTLVCLNKASNFAVEQLKLPVRDVTAGLKRSEFYVPGSILRTVLDTTHPIAAGMPKESIAWVEDSPAFEVSEQKEAGRVRVIARYPENADPLLSGWLLGGDKLRGKAALVEVTLGKGRVYLFGFRPQYRAQSLATYPLLFNAITRAGTPTM